MPKTRALDEKFGKKMKIFFCFESNSRLFSMPKNISRKEKTRNYAQKIVDFFRAGPIDTTLIGSVWQELIPVYMTHII